MSPGRGLRTRRPCCTSVPRETDTVVADAVGVRCAGLEVDTRSRTTSVLRGQGVAEDGPCRDGRHRSSCEYASASVDLTAVTAAKAISSATASADRGLPGIGAFPHVVCAAGSFTRRRRQASPRTSMPAPAVSTGPPRRCRPLAASGWRGQTAYPARKRRSCSALALMAMFLMGTLTLTSRPRRRAVGARRIRGSARRPPQPGGAVLGAGHDREVARRTPRSATRRAGRRGSTPVVIDERS